MNKVSATALETPHSCYRFSTRYLSEVPRTVGKILNKVSLQGIKLTEEKWCPCLLGIVLLTRRRSWVECKISTTVLPIKIFMLRKSTAGFWQASLRAEKLIQGIK